jgi:hypothetical protein
LQAAAAWDLGGANMERSQSPRIGKAIQGGAGRPSPNRWRLAEWLAYGPSFAFDKRKVYGCSSGRWRRGDGTMRGESPRPLLTVDEPAAVLGRRPQKQSSGNVRRSLSTMAGAAQNPRSCSSPF